MTNTLLCPTRGGEASYPNQDQAIELAKERDAHLIFLYVSNVHFLDLIAAPKVFDIEAELDEMGEFLLIMAQERAAKAGVEADTIVRRGEFRETLKEVIEEYQVTTVVLGAAGKETSVLTQEYIDTLSEELCSETGTEFIVVHQGEIVKFCTP
jgi:nucleotide-binding universal stress UspA family protein